MTDPNPEQALAQPISASEKDKNENEINDQDFMSEHNPGGDIMEENKFGHEHDDDDEEDLTDFDAEYAPGNTSGDKNRKEAEKETKLLSQKEDRAVLCLRIFLLLILVASTFAVSWGVYHYVDNEEEQEFQDQFASDAAKVISSVGTTLDNTLGPADALIVNLLAYAKGTNSSFPFVTLPDYGLQAAKLMRISKAFSMQMPMVVQQDQVPEWNTYTTQQKPEIRQAVEILKTAQDYPGPILTEELINKICPIWTFGGIPIPKPNAITNTYLPIWHLYPPMNGIGDVGCPYNFDNLQHPLLLPAVLQQMKTNKVLLSGFTNMNYNESDPFQKNVQERLEQWVARHISPDIDPAEPHNQIIFPILEGVTNQIQASDEQLLQYPYRGFLLIFMLFRRLIENALPEKSNGIILVVDQGCGQSFTYRLDGAVPTFVGKGDHHEAKYDHMEVRQQYETLVDATKLSRETAYTGIPVDETYCPKLFRIYPSSDMESNHRTNDPIVFAVVAGLIFVFTSLIFILYDWMVARRQRIVSNRAKTSGAIVSSLFPKDVREQLYENEESKKKKAAAKANFVRHESSHGSLHGSTHGTDRSSSGHDMLMNEASSNRIAKEYPECTVFFLDIAGFTKWSAAREPEQVFLLLESFFAAFDKLADRRGVFKIETIGDCYVAITGCPEPQRNHATNMVRFARACIAKVNELKSELSETLGPETQDLGCRIGLHTGPVTAGVLQGRKARFQLFGDTVNTASRMESNGVVGRIHCSEEMAQALRDAGKEYWIEKREDKIVAKGKGELQTYFISLVASSWQTGSHTGSSSGYTSDNGRPAIDHRIPEDADDIMGDETTIKDGEDAAADDEAIGDEESSPN